MIALSAGQVRALLTPERAIASQQLAFEELGRGRALQPPRLTLDGDDDSVAFCYAARLAPDGPAVSKFGSVNPANTGRGLPTVTAVITVLDPVTGVPVALMDGTTVTELRTSAASAVAARALAPDATRLAVIGTGTQAGAHVRAISRTHDLAGVAIVGRDPGRARALAGRLAAELALDVRAVASAEDAVRAADLVVTCTTSHRPVLADEWVADGACVISIGSFAADRFEVPRELARRAAVVVDHLPTALQDAGPVRLAVETGDVELLDIPELGAVLVEPTPAPARAPGRAVYYNSVGIGCQDAAAAAAVLAAAQSAGIGTPIEL